MGIPKENHYTESAPLVSILRNAINPWYQKSEFQTYFLFFISLINHLNILEKMDIRDFSTRQVL